MKISFKKSAMLAMAIVTALANTSYVSAAASDNEQIQTRDVVVAATRTEEEVKEVPADVEIITRDQIENMGAETLAQALQLATGIDILENGMVGNNVSIRGLKSIQTLIMIDGRRIRSEDTDSTANNYELQRVNMDDIERIEIVRGASSSLYGADAMGGVINLITRKPDKQETTVAGDWTTKQADASVRYASGKIDDKWSFSASFKHSNIHKNTTDSSSFSSGNTTNLGSFSNYRNYMSALMSGNYMAAAQYTNGKATYVAPRTKSSTGMYGDKDYFNFKANYDLTKNKHLEFFVDYMKEGLKDASTDNCVYLFTPSVAGAEVFTVPHVMLGGLTSPANSFVYKNDSIETTYDNTRLSSGIAYKGEDKKGTYQIRYSFARLDKDQKSYNHGNLIDFDKMTFTQHIIDGQRTIQANDNHLITYGGEYRAENYDGTRTGSGGDIHSIIEGGISKPAADTNLSYAAAYAQDEWMVSDKWLLIPSIRWDHNNRFGDKITWKLGSNYKFTNNFRFKTNFGTAYRAPSASELFMNMTHKPVAGIEVHVYGNDQLRPETSFNYDLGLEYEKGKNTMKATYFMSKIKNMIDSYDDGTSDEANNIYHYKYQNRDKVTISGLEFDTTQKFDNNWALRGVLTYLDARDDETGAFLTGRARTKTSLQLRYASDEKDLNATLWYDWYHGYQYSASRIETLGILNFVVNKKISKNASVYFGVNNILDKYNDYLSFEGRVWRAGFNVKF